MFVDGRVHTGAAQKVKDEELRSLLGKRGYRVLELGYKNLLGQEERRIIPGNLGQPRKRVVSSPMRRRGGLEVMKPRRPRVHDSEFLQIAMRILKREKQFLEKIGKL